VRQEMVKREALAERLRTSETALREAGESAARAR
jgi:hypothetical protein